MDTLTYGPLQAREIFHLEFLRRFSQKMRPGQYALKGGVNLRLFFRSPRYSEDMDLDVHGASVDKVRDLVMAVLESRPFRDTLASYGIADIVPPDLRSAKQTETTQRFKIHLTVAGGEDLFTKVEVSRRGACAGAVVEPVRPEVVRHYKAPPLFCSHYAAPEAYAQKLGALAGRSVVQARDIFDLYLLDTQADATALKSARPGPSLLKAARENLLSVDFARFRDTVLPYLAPEEAGTYVDPARWDDVRLAVSQRIESLL